MGAGRGKASIRHIRRFIPRVAASYVGHIDESRAAGHASRWSLQRHTNKGAH